MEKLKLKTAGVVICTVYLIIIITNILTILKVISFGSIIGINFNYQEVTVVIAVATIVFLSLSIFINLAAAKIIPISYNKLLIIMLKLFIWFQTVFLAFSIIVQFTGITFEKICLAILILFGFIASFRIALEKRMNYLN